MKMGVYVLFSLKDKRTYVGSTNDLNRRLFEHQQSRVAATKNRLPIKLVYFEKFNNLEDARKREHYYKSCAGRKKLKLMLNKIIIDNVRVPRLASTSDSESRRVSAAQKC